MRFTRLLGAAGALIAAALVGGTLIGSAFAADETDMTDASGGAYCQTFLDAFAAELGVTRDEVTAAGKTAASAAIDAAVGAGDLSEERAADLRERIDAAEGDGCGLLHPFRAGFGHGWARGFLSADVLEAAADALGLERADLVGQLGDAGSLEAVATAQAVDYATVKSAVLDAAQADLDAAVENGMDPDRAAAAIDRLSGWLDDGGTPPNHRGGRGPGHGPWGP